MPCMANLIIRMFLYLVLGDMSVIRLFVIRAKLLVIMKVYRLSFLYHVLMMLMVKIFLRADNLICSIYKRNIVSFVATAITQLDKTSDGPIGLSSTYLRNAMLPTLDAQIQLTNNNIFFATSINFKRVVPRLSSIVNDTLFKVHETLNS